VDCSGSLGSVRSFSVDAIRDLKEGWNVATGVFAALAVLLAASSLGLATAAAHGLPLKGLRIFGEDKRKNDIVAARERTDVDKVLDTRLKLAGALASALAALVLLCVAVGFIWFAPTRPEAAPPDFKVAVVELAATGQQESRELACGPLLTLRADDVIVLDEKSGEEMSFSPAQEPRIVLDQRAGCP
jgi:hypothetical protein